MTAAIVDLADLALRRLVVLEDQSIGAIEGDCKRQRGLIAGLVTEVLDRNRQRQEFPERVPAQVVFLLKLLHVLRGGSARARLVEAAAREQRNNRQHLGA